MGPGYGWQWRHYGCEYKANEQLEIGNGMEVNGRDQLKNVISLIELAKQYPNESCAKRLLVTAWNPMDLEKMALPCCHYSFQFSVEEDRLNCLVNMRSCDVPLGAPFNIASYALLCYMICHLVQLTPGKLVFSLADAHIYMNAMDAIKEQITRTNQKMAQSRNSRRIQIY